MPANILSGILTEIGGDIDELLAALEGLKGGASAAQMEALIAQARAIGDKVPEPVEEPPVEPAP